MIPAELPVLHAGPLDAALAELIASRDDVVRRLWERDHTLWRDDPTEIADRLGWLTAPDASRAHVEAWANAAKDALTDGFRHVVVIGMGGSSLFPDVLRQTFPATGCTLEVLDSTHPAAVQRVLDLPVQTTLFVTSSKSGSTLETRSHLEAAWASRADALDDPGRAFIAVTDPGSELEALATERGFRAIFHGDPEVGGRFSALTAFGLVPAALLGVNVEELLERASAQAALEAIDAPVLHPGFTLGAFLAAGATSGRDKVTLVLDPRLAAFGDWVEQLVAESLGKEGTSVTPIVGDDRTVNVPTGEDRVHVVVGEHPGRDALVAAGGPVMELPLGDELDLGAQVILWEVATAVAGALLGLHPFDQPDVASAKAAAATVLEAGLSDVAQAPLAAALGAVEEGDLLAITAFVDPGSEEVLTLERVRERLTSTTGRAVSLGIGPRYLHSTGQLHKGGDANIVVLQVVDDPAIDVAIPGRDEGFRTIFLAQAEGDLRALQERGRRAFRVSLDDLLAVVDDQA